MDKNSTKYTFIFAFVMVVVVGILLASAATFLKPRQLENEKELKMQDILMAIEIQASADEAHELFDKYITEQKVLNAKGELLSDTLEAFDISLEEEQQKDRRGESEQRLYPLFIGEKDKVKFVIIPMRGQGLWGPIWGYIALEDDYNTIYGANFDHKSETPGLGAEINRKQFESQFKGKKIFDDKEFVSVKVVKGGAPNDDPHAVDGISGGTITSHGVSDMLKSTLSHYLKYLKKGKK